MIQCVQNHLQHKFNKGCRVGLLCAEVNRLVILALSWLTTEQIKTLLETMDKFSLNPHVKLITKISLATGARWGEAEGLTLDKLQDKN